jgi:hypothetical protein
VHIIGNRVPPWSKVVHIIGNSVPPWSKVGHIIGNRVPPWSKVVHIIGNRVPFRMHKYFYKNVASNHTVKNSKLNRLLIVNRGRIKQPSFWRGRKSVF